MERTPWHSYEVSLAIWDYTVLPATRHKWTHPALITARQAGTPFTYPGGMEGWVDLTDLTAPRPGVEPATFRSRVRHPTTAPPRQWLINASYAVRSAFSATAELLVATSIIACLTSLMSVMFLADAKEKETQNSTATAAVTKITHQPKKAPRAPPDDVNDWRPIDIRKWLKSNNLQHLHSWYHDSKLYSKVYVGPRLILCPSISCNA